MKVEDENEQEGEMQEGKGTRMSWYSKDSIQAYIQRRSMILHQMLDVIE